MKWFLGIFMILAGTTLGGSVAYYRDKDPGDDYRSLFEMVPYADKATAPASVNPEAPEESRVEIDNGREFDFGVMDVGEKRDHTFLVRNSGNTPLEMKLIRTTCKCAIGELPNGAIMPGEVGDVSLDWTAKNYAREFRQSATIETNDPQNPLLILSVYGRVIQSVSAIPASLAMGDSTVDDDRIGTVSLQAFKDPELKIESFEWIASDFEEFLEVDWKPAEKVEGAVAACDIQVRLKPGMPYGKFKETLLVKLSSAPGRMEIPVSGRVVSDISIVGKNYRDRSGVLRMGIIPTARGGSAELMLLVKGPHREDVQFTKGLTEPVEGIDVRIGEPTTYGTVVKYPIEVIIPSGAAPVQRRSSDENPGKIVLRTTHPEIETVELLVSYAVVDQ